MVDESDFSPRKLKVLMAILLGTMFGSSILPMMAHALLLLPMTEEFGWSRTQFSGGLSAMMLGGAISAPFLGILVDKIGVRPLIIAGTFVVGLMTMSLSKLGGQIWQFYTAFAVLGFMGSSAIGYAKVIGALFTKHRGKAFAILGAESAIAGAIVPPSINLLMEHFGWRGMLFALGCTIWATIPFLIFMLEEPGTKLGEHRVGNNMRRIWARIKNGRKSPEDQIDAGFRAPALELPGINLWDALRDKSFWLISVAMMLSVGPAIGMMPHYIPHLAGQGFDIKFVVWMFSLMTLAMAIGSVIGGVLLDLVDRAWIAVPFSLLTGLCLMGLTQLTADIGGTPVLVIIMLATGFAAGAKRPMGTFFQVRFFGVKDFGGIIGFQSPLLAISMAISPLAVGWCFDRYGTYEPALWVMSGSMVIAAGLYLALGPYRFGKELTNSE